MIFLEIPQNQWKTKENYQKPMFFLCFHWVWPKIIKWHHLRIEKNILSIIGKKTFLPNTWNTLKTSFLKCLRVCNFFFSQRCWCSQHLKNHRFWILCENSEHLTAQLQISTQQYTNFMMLLDRSDLHFWAAQTSWITWHRWFYDLEFGSFSITFPGTSHFQDQAKINF